MPLNEILAVDVGENPIFSVKNTLKYLVKCFSF
jgi:hypothetical protein